MGGNNWLNLSKWGRLSSIVLVVSLFACVGTGNTIANTAGVKDCFEKWRKAIIAGRLKEAYKRTSVAFLSKIVLTFFQTPRIPDRVKDGLIEKLPVDKRKIFGEWSRMNLGLKRPSILPKYYFDSGWVFEVYKKDFEYSQTSALLKDMVIKNIGIDAAGASIMVRHPVIGTAFYCLIIEDKMWKLDDFIPPATLPR